MVRTDIARELGVSYNYVYNVVSRMEDKSARPSQEATAPLGSNDKHVALRELLSRARSESLFNFVFGSRADYSPLLALWDGWDSTDAAEFLQLFANANAEGARTLAEEVRKSGRALSFLKGLSEREFGYLV